jgi:hypothetical protein
MTASSHWVRGDDGYGHSGYGCLAGPARSAPDGWASRTHLSAGPGGGRLRAAELGQAIGREAVRRDDRPRSLGPFGANSTVRQADPQGSVPGQRGQAGTSRPSAPHADPRRPPRGAHPLGLPPMPRARSDLGRRPLQPLKPRRDAGHRPTPPGARPGPISRRASARRSTRSR